MNFNRGELVGLVELCYLGKTPTKFIISRSISDHLIGKEHQDGFQGNLHSGYISSSGLVFSHLCNFLILQFIYFVFIQIYHQQNFSLLLYRYSRLNFFVPRRPSLFLFTCGYHYCSRDRPSGHRFYPLSLCKTALALRGRPAFLAENFFSLSAKDEHSQRAFLFLCFLPFPFFHSLTHSLPLLTCCLPLALLII